MAELISKGRHLYVDKEKIQALIDKQRTNLAEVKYLDLDDVANKVEKFENPKHSEGNLSEGDGLDSERTKQETDRILAGNGSIFGKAAAIDRLHNGQEKPREQRTGSVFDEANRYSEESEKRDKDYSADKDYTEKEEDYSVRTKPAPKKTKKVYKLMRLVKDKLFPLFIDRAEPIKMGTWYDADSPGLDMIRGLESGVHIVDAKSGTSMTIGAFAKEHPELFKGGKIGVRPSKEAVNYATEHGLRWIRIEDTERGQKRFGGESRKYWNIGINGSGAVGDFSMRPGWHAGSLPTMRQIGKGSGKDLRDKSFVWVEGEVSADKDYNGEAQRNPDKDIPDRIPEDGFYMKATNADAVKSQADKVGWYVAGSFKANRVISDAEARRVIDEYNASHPGGEVLYDYNREGGTPFSDADAQRANKTNGVKEEDYSRKTLKPDTEIKIVRAEEEHGFKNYAEARSWAKENIVRVYSNEETKGKGEINVSNKSVGKFLSESAVGKSENRDVHLAVLKVLPEVIRESVDAEQHVDYNVKDENGRRQKALGHNPDVNIRILYGAVGIKGKTYHVKITLKENVRTGDMSKAYSYEATKIELLAGQHENVGETFSRNSNSSITAAKLLKGVKKSYSNETFFSEGNLSEGDGLDSERTKQETDRILAGNGSIFGKAAAIDRLHNGQEKPREQRRVSVFDEANRYSEESEKRDKDYSADKDYTEKEEDYSVRTKAPVKARDRYDKKVNSRRYQAREALQDSMLGLKTMMESVLRGEGKRRVSIDDIPDFENPYLGENRYSSVVKNRFDRAAKELFSPLIKEMRELIAKGSGDRKDRKRELNDYLLAKPNGRKTEDDFYNSLLWINPFGTI